MRLSTRHAYESKRRKHQLFFGLHILVGARTHGRSFLRSPLVWPRVTCNYSLTTNAPARSTLIIIISIIVRMVHGQMVHGVGKWNECSKNITTTRNPTHTLKHILGINAKICARMLTCSKANKYVSLFLECAHERLYAFLCSLFAFLLTHAAHAHTHVNFL